MDRSPSNQTFVRDLGVLFQAGAIGGLSDRELLGHFAARSGDVAQRAFEAIVRRYGPMVLGVCRRVLGDVQLAEDAFQATFLVLALKAGAIRKPDSLGPWLHGVAGRIARRARDARPPVAQRVEALPDLAAGGEESFRSDVFNALDEEIGRLPAAYRKAIVLCYLEGKTQEDAARALGWTKGTVSGRLARAKDLLRARLTRRGLTPSVGLFVGMLGEESYSATVPLSLATTTARIAQGVVLGRAETVAASAAVITLARGGLRALALGKLKVVAATLLMATSLVAGVAWTNAGPPGAEPAEQTALAPIPKRPRVVRASLISKLEPREAPLPKGARLRLGTTRLRHEEPIQRITISPDGKALASISAGGVNLHFWDMATGEASTRHPNLKDANDAGRVAYSPDGTRLAICKRGGVIVLVDPATGTEHFRAHASQHEVREIAFAPDGKMLATISEEEAFVRLWEVSSGKLQQTITPDFPSVRLGPVTFSPDGRKLALVAVTTTSAADPSQLCVWEIETGRWTSRITASAHPISGLVFSADGDHLISAGNRYFEEPGRDLWKSVPELQVWDLRTGNMQRDVALGKLEAISSIALSRDGSFLVSLHPDRLIAWNMPGWNLRRMIPIDPVSPQTGNVGLALSSDNRSVAVYRSNKIRLWDIATGKALIDDLDSHTSAIRSVTVDPAGRMIATGDSGGQTRLWDARLGKYIGSPGVKSSGVLGSLKFSPNGVDLLVTANHRDVETDRIGGKVCLWDTIRKEFRFELKFDDPVFAAAFSPDGSRVAIADWRNDRRPINHDLSKPLTNSVRIIDARTGEKKLELSGLTGSTHAVGFASDGRSLATLTLDGVVRFWDPATARETRQVRVPVGRWLHDIAIAPDLSSAVVCDYLEPVKIYDLKTGDLRQSLKVANGFGIHACFSPDGRMVASALQMNDRTNGMGQSIRLWRVDDGQEVLQLEPGYPHVFSMAFSPDGKSLVTGMNDTTTLVWDVSAAYVAKPAKAD
jgi:RNA polymerase sigma factor (sigma-70 family)